MRAYGKTIEETIAASPEALAPLRLHYLRWVLFDVGSGLHFQYQGIFDTDFDKYTEDAVKLFSATGITTVFTNLEGFPEDWKENPGAFMKFVREHQCPSFLEYGEYPYVTADEIKKALRLKAAFSDDARPDAVALGRDDMLELDDIQHILLTRTPAITGRYEFLTFDTHAGGRAWLSELLDLVQSAADAHATRWTRAGGGSPLAFTWTGLRALGGARGVAGNLSRRVPRRNGVPRRHPRRHRPEPSRQLGGRPRRRRPARHRDPFRPRRRAVARYPSTTTTSCSHAPTASAACRTSTLNATPPFNYAHDHFGFRDRLSQPVMEGSGEEPTPGSGALLKPGEFILGYPDEDGAGGQSATARNTFPQWKLHGLPPPAGTRDGRSATTCARTPRRPTTRNCSPPSSWAAGAAAPRWCWHPTRTTPSWAQTRCATTTTTTRKWTRSATPCPLGSHTRRLNPRDTAHNMNRRRMIRRGATYGPHLPEGAPDDGVDRGIAAFIICADLIRQFEFAQNVWINDKTFHELGNEHDPICGTQDGTLEFTVPKRPIRKVHKGIPAFTTLTGGAYFFLPGINALRYLTTLGGK